MTVRTSAGTTLKVSASTPATFDATGYNALTMTVVGEVSDLGEFGREPGIEFGGLLWCDAEFFELRVEGGFTH